MRVRAVSPSSLRARLALACVALIAAVTAAGLPERFDFFIELDGLHASCQTVRP